jgi:hypothetical protein
MGRGKNLVGRAIAAAGDDAINFSSASFSNCFAGQSYSIAGFPSDPHVYDLTVLAQCANGRSQSSIAGCLAVHNNSDVCHTFRPRCSRAQQVQLGLEFAARCAATFYHTPRSTATAILSLELEWATLSKFGSDIWPRVRIARMHAGVLIFSLWLLFRTFINAAEFTDLDD